MARTTAVVVGTASVPAPAGPDEYMAQLARTLDRYGGRVLVAGPVTVLEGDAMPSVATVLEFPDAVAAATWFDSPEHTALRALRSSGAGHVLLVEASANDAASGGR